MSNILIVDFHCPSNRGDDAILTALLALLRESLPQPAVTVHTTYPHLVSRGHAVPAREPLFVTKRGSLWRHRLRIRRLTARPRRGLTPALDDFLDADLVIGMAGGFYNDNYHPDILGRLAHLELARRLGKPTAVAAHSFGPFRQPRYRRMARRVLPQVDLLCARDDPSLHVLRDLGVPDHRILRTADPAWVLPPAAPQRARDILHAESVPTQRPIVTVASRLWPHYCSVPPDAGNRNYLAAVARAADHAAQAWGAHVLFASTCTDEGGYRVDDRKTADAIRAEMRHPHHASVLRGPYPAPDLAAVYGCAALHLGTRMHSIIMAAGRSTPVVGIAYEPKVRGLMAELGLADAVCDLEGLSAPALIETMERAWSARAATRQALPARVEALAAQARHGVAAICDLIGEAHGARD